VWSIPHYANPSQQQTPISPAAADPPADPVTAACSRDVFGPSHRCQQSPDLSSRASMVLYMPPPTTYSSPFPSRPDPAKGRAAGRAGPALQESVSGQYTSTAFSPLQDRSCPPGSKGRHTTTASSPLLLLHGLVTLNTTGDVMGAAGAGRMMTATEQQQQV